MASKREQKAQRGTAKQDKAARRAVEEGASGTGRAATPGCLISAASATTPGHLD